MRKLGLLVSTLVAFSAPSVAQAAGSAASIVAKVLPRAEQVGIVESTEAISTSLGDAEAGLNPQYVAGSDTMSQTGTPVTIVVARGQFTDTLVPTPASASAPSGSVMAFTVNGETGEVMETYVGNHAPTAAIGTVALKGRASSARVRRARIAMRRRQATARAATWGDKCSASGNHHCYALAIWSMHPSEYVLGSETIQNTSVMNVPDWEKGDFVSNEEWSGFYNGGAAQYWTEIGQIGGYGENCCSIYAFKAYQNVNGFAIRIIGEQPKSAENHYLMHAGGEGVWCWYVGPYGEGCVGGFEAYSKDLEDGTEMADEAQPLNAAWVETNWIGKEGYAYQWNFAEDGLFNEQGKQSYNGECVAKYTPWNYAGNIYTGSYGECP